MLRPSVGFGEFCIVLVPFFFCCVSRFVSFGDGNMLGVSSGFCGTE